MIRTHTTPLSLYIEAKLVIELGLIVATALAKCKTSDRGHGWRCCPVSCIIVDFGMGRGFEIIDHTADIGIVAYGADMEEVFSNAALALLSLITNPESVEERLHLDVKVSAEDRGSLLVEWLNELIYLFDARHALFNRFGIERLTTSRLEARCYGEYFDPTRHEIKTGVKAVTYHMLQLDRNTDGYRAQVILDV